MNNEIKTILQALVDGEEIEFSGTKVWCKSSLDTTLNVLSQWSHDNTSIGLRIKPKTIQIGGFTVPEPMRIPPPLYSTYFYTDPTAAPNVCSHVWQHTQIEHEWLENGFLQATKEGAEQQVAAILSLTKEKK